MNKKAWIKRKMFIYLSLLIIITIITVSFCFKKVNAASNCDMDEGKIIITITSKTATSSIRYRTLGFNVTTKKQENMVSAKGDNGKTIWGPDAPPSPSKRLPLDAGTKKTSEDPKTGETTVTYTYDEEYVKDLMRNIIDLDRLDVITDQTPIYFNAVFQTYQIVNGKEVIITPEITTWRGIVNNQKWANKDVFKDYFNIEVKFDAGLQPNDLYFKIDDSIKKQGSLGTKLIGESLSWETKVTDTYTDKNNVQYKLTGYYIKSKLTDQEIDRKMVGGSIKTSDIINGSVKVLYGGLDVYMIYKPYNLEISIDAKDIDTDEDIKQGLYTGTVEPGESFKKSIDNIITANGDSYSKTKHFYYLYTNKSGNIKKIKVTTNSDDSPIEFKIPNDVKTPGEITVKAYYKASDIMTDEIKLRVIMASKSGSLIDEISTEKVTKGQAISKTIQSDRYVKGLTYQYIDKWDYTYASSSGETTKTGSGNKASFTVPQATKLGTVITLRLYYDASQEVEVPVAAPTIGMPIDTPSPYAVINGDKYGANYFFSKNGISTTESQHVYVKTKDYLLGYRLVNRTGKVTFTVPVTMTYTLQYFTATPKEFGGPKPVTDTVTNTQHISVERAYSYWEIESLEYYIPSSANVYNYSLPNGGVSLNANGSYLDVPDLTTWHSSNLKEHYELPSQANGIQLTCETPFTSDNDDRPQVEYQDLTSYALEMAGQLKVKNDYLVFNGSTVMSNTLSDKIAPYPNYSPLAHSNNIIHDKVLYTEGQIVDALKRNGVYQSNGNVTYARHPM
ncbi:MAG: DUF5704 domain-containing protein, partial [Herbinix sp.]|nr:DUF5704 domain-containing protein [Herbinix sp.]